MTGSDHTKASLNMQNALADLLRAAPKVAKAREAIAQRGGRALLVGGAVRDILLAQMAGKTDLPGTLKDIDIEVHGLSAQQLQETLSQFGTVDQVGKSFGVFKWFSHQAEPFDVDWSLPRTDAAGRKPEVTVDPHLPLRDAFIRRDFTINAMGIDLETGELIDFFGGFQDLENRVLRSPDITFFVEDPLRFYRVMQFVGRFTMQPDDALNAVCREMDISEVSIERVEQEFRKLLLKSQKPSRGFCWLQEVGRLAEILPELAATHDVVQDPEWHPEGDVFTHTMQAVDAAAVIAHDAYGDDPEKQLTLLYAVLCHDLGKVTTTEQIEGRWRALGHETEGVTPTKEMLKRIVTTKDLIASVATLVRYHMVPFQFVTDNVSDAAYKRLAEKLGSDLSLRQLAWVALADKQGRNPEGTEPLRTPFKKVDSFVARAERVGVLYVREEPMLQGRDLLDSVSPGKQIGDLLRRAYRIQIEEGITDVAELKRRVLAR